MQRLHRRRHALGREARAARRRAASRCARRGAARCRARRRRGRRRARPRPPGRRSRASRTGSPARREARDDRGVAVRVGPERLGPLAVRAGLEQPAGAAVDDAVDEELRHARRASAARAGRAVLQQPGDLVVADVGLHQQRARTQRTVRSPRASSVATSSNSHGQPSITCAPVSPSALSRRRRLRVGVEPLGVGARRDVRPRPAPSRAPRAARRSARRRRRRRPPRRRRTRARPVDAGERQRRPARQRRVVVEERQVRGRVAGDVGDRVRGDRAPPNAS